MARAYLGSALDTFKVYSVTTALYTIDAGNGYRASMDFYNNGTKVWQLGKSSALHTGGNVGSDFNLVAFDDSGTLIGTVFNVPRATMVLNFPTGPTTTEAIAAGNSTTRLSTTAWVQGEFTALKAAANTWSNFQTFYTPGTVSGILIDSDPLPSQQTATMVWRRGGLNRWQLQLIPDETGSGNGGGTLSMRAFTDAGTSLGTAFDIARSTQIVTFIQSPIVPTPTTTDNSTKAASTAYVRAYAPSGTYTPTISNTTNVAGSTAYVAHYHRVGDVVMVSGKVDIDPTAASVNTLIGISLPIPSNFTADSNANGVAFCGVVAGLGARVFADVTNDRASLQYLNGADITNRGWSFMFQYIVL